MWLGVCVNIILQNSYFNSNLIIIHSIHMQAQQLMALLAGFLVMLVNGSLYIYGTMTPYIFTFLHNKGTPPSIQVQQ